MRRVTRRGGDLDLLGAGTELISEKARLSLRTWKRRLIGLQCAVSSLFAVACLNNIITAAGTGHHSDAWKRASSAMTLISFPLSTASVFAWWYTMKIAAALSTTKVQQTADRIKQWPKLKAAAGPGEELAVWREEVVKPVFRLAQVTMPTLSAGWGRPLLAIAVGFLFFVLVFAFKVFVLWRIQSAFENVVMVICVFMFIALPFGLALEPARASSKCDRLVDSLNKVSLDELDENRELWMSLDRVITTLNRTNRGQ